MVSKDLLSILLCPIERQPLALAETELIDRINTAIREQRLTNASGQRVEEELSAGLLREDGQLLYPVIDEIPILLADESIELAQLEKQAEKPS